MYKRKVKFYLTDTAECWTFSTYKYTENATVNSFYLINNAHEADVLRNILQCPLMAEIFSTRMYKFCPATHKWHIVMGFLCQKFNGVSLLDDTSPYMWHL